MESGLIARKWTKDNVVSNGRSKDLRVRTIPVQEGNATRAQRVQRTVNAYRPEVAIIYRAVSGKATSRTVGDGPLPKDVKRSKGKVPKGRYRRYRRHGTSSACHGT